jgi:endonuclease/exonuclease/phosphatase family metal-dependent hydrolase
MKILTWNCNQGIGNDFSAIKQFDADVVIIQECEKLDKNSFEGYSSHWIGNNDRKGLAVLTKEKSALPTEVFNESLIYFLPVSFKDTAVLGVWAFNRRARRKVVGSSGFPIDAINHYKDWLTSHKNMIVAGDFNNGPRWDRPGSRNNFHTFNSQFNQLGLYSAYHSFSGELPGQESKPTYFHQRNPEKRFHIDYIFSNLLGKGKVHIGDFKEWSKFSDHMPLITDLV